ncbi:MAG TPA: Rne/Rng family ribonuclease [bacterium]|nr:Rne/Rng family ribonuclease [bacterium]
MGKQIMLVNAHEDESRIALVENGVLVGLHVQQTNRERKVGNIYRGRVVKINPAFQAAFVDYGESRNGFLSISDVNFNLHKPRDAEKGRPKIQNVLREGQSVMVQIIKEGMSNKGSALTTFISLAGRYMVMSPNSERSGVSRKIEDPDTRRRLKDIMEALAGGEDLGVIIRTAGIDQPVAELKKDLEALRKEWKSIQSKHEKEKKPGLLHQEASPIVRVLRDYFTDAVQEVWVDDAEGFQEALRYFKSTMPKYQKRLKLYVGDKSLFSAYRIEEQIESLDTAKVPLKSGGSVVIEATEALVSVDVNSGRSNQAQDIEETALRTNLEAAEEISRQLRLRNLGGLIVIDFIDMMQAKHRKEVEKTVADALKDDKARTTIGNISQFGLLELSRQRIDMELSRGLRVQCPNCGGTGHIPTVNSSANNVLRKIRELAATGQYSEVHGELPLDSANYLLNEKREALRDLEQEFEIALKLEADPQLPAGATILLHGVKSGDAEAESEREERPERAERHERVERPERRDRPERAERAERAEASTPPAAEDDGHRRRRRRRRRRGGEEGATKSPSRFTDEESQFGDEHARYAEEQRRFAQAQADLDEEDVSGLGGANRLAEELDVEELEREEEEAALETLVEGEHEFETPHAELHAEPGIVEHREQREPAIPLHVSDNGQSKGLVFRSEHIVTNPEALEKMPPRIVRSNPFEAVAAGAAPNTVVFDSANLYGQPEVADEMDEEAAPKGGDEAEGEAKSASSHRRRRGRRGGKSAAAEESAAPAVDEASSSEPVTATPEPAYEEDLEDSIGNLKEPEAPAKDAARRKPRRGRSRSDGSAAAKPKVPATRKATEAAASAPVDGDAPAAKRRRPRRGRGRGSRPQGETTAATAS